MTKLGQEGTANKLTPSLAISSELIRTIGLIPGIRFRVPRIIMIRILLPLTQLSIESTAQVTLKDTVPSR